MSAVDDLLYAIRGDAGPRATHNSEGVRVTGCSHGSRPPPAGWCVYCDKPKREPRPAKVRFTPRNDGVRAVGITKVGRYEADERWRYIGEICSNDKPIARVYEWLGNDPVDVFDEDRK